MMPGQVTNRAAALWAKTARGEPDVFHPLSCHLIDVASVARVLLERGMPSALRKRIASGLGLELEDEVIAWVSYLAGLHDIGKASPGFQIKHGPGWARVLAAGFSAPIEPRDVGHGTVSALVLREEILTDPKLGGFSRRVVARYIAGAIGGHHGVFPSSDNVNTADVEAVRGGVDWVAARRDLALTLANLTDIHGYSRPQTIDAKTATIIAGLTSVADWIGSDERYFPHAARGEVPPALDIGTYAKHARDAAQRALGDLGWLDWTPSGDRLTFADLFDHIRDLRPLQRTITELEHLTGAPGIAIIEVPMGEGKTEAAFYLADQWSSTIGQNGCYVAMPTMATSNQMFDRLRAFLVQRYPHTSVNLQLLHSQAALAIDLEAGERGSELPVQAREDHDVEPGLLPTQVVVLEWFTRRKRGLLAPFGVGTVDQSLLAILSTPHHFVRLFGLAGKTVIFDEVHAYDVFMNELFECLMTWLGALGSSVVVLSATLPDHRRRSLLAAYADGAGVAGAESDLEAAYPRLSWTNAAGHHGAREVGTSADIRRTLGVGWIDIEDSAVSPWANLVQALSEQLAEGGCAAIICNTVRQAQEVYQALQPFFPGDADDGEPELDLLHARFPFEERERRERRALRRFGKPGGVVVDGSGKEIPVERPRRAVLVSTQIIEQSLDLDFDLMVSEIAPADLLLQRSGRLHRHRRTGRPPGLQNPTLWVLRPDAEEGIPHFRGGTPYVYDRHVLFRSWLALSGRQAITIPEDIGPLIEAVYDPDMEPDANLSSMQRAHWAATFADHNRDLRGDVEQARKRTIPLPAKCQYIEDLTRDFRAEDGEELHQAHRALTRLGGPSVSLICLYATPHGAALDPAGDNLLDPDRTPTVALARRLLRRSVTVSVSRAAERLLRVEPPKPWQQSSLLRHHRLAIFDEDGGAMLGGVQLRLDPELGLLIEGTEDA